MATKKKPVKKAKPVKAAKKAGKRKAAKPKRQTPRSQTLPGMEQVRHTKLDRLCEGISECREEMNEQRGIEAEKCRGALVYMHDNSITTYRYAGVELVRVPGEEKLRVRTSKEKATLETDDEETGSGLTAREIAEALTPDEERLEEQGDAS